MNDSDYVADKTPARKLDPAQDRFRIRDPSVPAGRERGWLDPLVDVGIMFGSVLPSDQFARFLAERLAKVGCPIAVFKIFPRHGRQVVAVIGDEVPPLAGPRSTAGRDAHDRKNSAWPPCRVKAPPANAIAVWPNAHPLIADTRTAFHTS